MAGDYMASFCGMSYSGHALIVFNHWRHTIALEDDDRFSVGFELVRVLMTMVLEVRLLELAVR